MRIFNLGLWAVVLAALGAPAALGCSSNDDRGSQESLGTLNVNLTGTSSSGIRYRLRNAIFEVNGPDDVVLFSENDVNAPTIQQDLAVGNYIVELADGWSLERETAGMFFEPVDAALTSANPAAFVIAEQGVTGVVFAFKAGDDVLELGHGVLELSINVEDEGCQAGDVLCGDTCTDVSSDPDNCGACGVSCAEGESCSAGACVGDEGCQAGDVLCGETCTDVSSDRNNCGACGLSCAEGEGCNAGVCGANLFSEFFEQGVTSNDQCTRWDAFRSAIGIGPFSSITLRGSQDMVGQTCTGPDAQALCDALRDGLTFSTVCDGTPWNVGICGGVEVSTTSSVCACDFGSAARPCVGNHNWGGIKGDTCFAPSQTIEVLCQ